MFTFAPTQEPSLRHTPLSFYTFNFFVYDSPNFFFIVGPQIWSTLIQQSINKFSPLVSIIALEIAESWYYFFLLLPAQERPIFVMVPGIVALAAVTFNFCCSYLLVGVKRDFIMIMAIRLQIRLVSFFQSASIVNFQSNANGIDEPPQFDQKNRRYWVFLNGT